MTTFQSQALPFQIRVIEGDLSQAQLQSGQPLGVVALAGRAGPFRPIKIGGAQRVQTTFYPGNPVGTQQVIGPTEDPTTLTGEWNDRYLGDGQAMAMVALFDQLRRRGLSVEVSWGHGIGGTTEAPTLTTDPLVRVGIITKATFTIQRVQDVEWEAEFTWRSQGQNASPTITATGQINPREGFSDVVDDLQLSTALWTAVQHGPQVSTVGLPQAVLDGMDQVFQQVETAIDSIQQASATITSAVVIPASAALQLVGACNNAIDALTNMATTILSVNLLAQEVGDAALDIVRYADQFFTVLGQTDVAKGTCCDNRDGIMQNTEPDVIAQVVVPAGTDLRDLAAQFYGSADLWFLIASFNNIDGSAVPSPPTGPSDQPNLPIQIPRPTSSTSSDPRWQC